ncbi:Alg9-like mannosyltransferase family-domain-containing protein [Cytidiella melzeri]|nr:Alg9-like mannosyltransferase family-domain-containing protein [Cytidiella melzeri]
MSHRVWDRMQGAGDHNDGDPQAWYQNYPLSPSHKPAFTGRRQALRTFNSKEQTCRSLARPIATVAEGTHVRELVARLPYLLLVRVTGAMYSGLSDCDEAHMWVLSDVELVFNFWEPLNYLDRGHAFQTWETSPQYSIRSWANILIHLFPAKVFTFMFGPEKRPAFFAVRVVLALVSATCETFFYRTVVDKINYRVGRYLFFMMLFSAGMWDASVAFLPSSFAMYSNCIGFAYFIEPTSSTNMRRTLLATMAFATGALIGWPFSIVVALPFVFEELFLYAKDNVAPMNQTSWRIQRWSRLLQCGLVAVLLLFPVVAIDTLFYGKLGIVPWNIVEYNVLSSNHGPNLYGTEPLSFYVNNLLLNTNVALPFAVLSLPALLITHRVDFKRLGERAGPERSSPYTLMAMRLLPMYVWFALLHPRGQIGQVRLASPKCVAMFGNESVEAQPCTPLQERRTLAEAHKDVVVLFSERKRDAPKKVDDIGWHRLPGEYMLSMEGSWVPRCAVTPEGVVIYTWYLNMVEWLYEQGAATSVRRKPKIPQRLGCVRRNMQIVGEYPGYWIQKIWGGGESQNCKAGPDIDVCSKGIAQFQLTWT